MSDSHFKNPDLPSVGIVRTIPKVSQAELFSFKRCYLGISLDNSIFEASSLLALLLWTVRNFDQCLVVVGDYLCRFNEYILNGLAHDEAIKVAYGLGDSFIDRTSEFFRQLPKGRTRLTRWKSHLETNEYKKSRAMLDELFASDSAFRASIEKEASSFARRQTKRNRTLAVTIEEAIRLSSEYLLEEIAVFSALSEQGWQVELYPGPELQVLVDITKGKYSPVPEGLKKRINVELRIDETAPPHEKSPNDNPTEAD